MERDRGRLPHRARRRVRQHQRRRADAPAGWHLDLPGAGTGGRVPPGLAMGIRRQRDVSRFVLRQGRGQQRQPRRRRARLHHGRPRQLPRAVRAGPAPWRRWQIHRQHQAQCRQYTRRRRLHGVQPRRQLQHPRRRQGPYAARRAEQRDQQALLGLPVRELHPAGGPAQHQPDGEDRVLKAIARPHRHPLFGAGFFLVVAESPGNGVGCVVDAVDFVDAPALSPAPPPQAGEGRKQVGSETLPGSPARAKQPRRPSPPSGKTNVDNHESVIYNIVYTLNRFCRQFSRHINTSPWRTAQSSEGPRVAYRQRHTSARRLR
ncbi:hypothetical protein CBM2623_B170493 [Cupriavidus taiwanensis]|nr:hypothetical protein CBM2608_B140561 [Cupriavidus taiwanensis]SPA33449.1 hypothetical protein CBM2623_B170493 [Cupriavidus taiwanensis]